MQVFLRRALLALLLLATCAAGRCARIVSIDVTPFGLDDSATTVVVHVATEPADANVRVMRDNAFVADRVTQQADAFAFAFDGVSAGQHSVALYVDSGTAADVQTFVATPSFAPVLIADDPTWFVANASMVQAVATVHGTAEPTAQVQCALPGSTSAPITTVSDVGAWTCVFRNVRVTRANVTVVQVVRNTWSTSASRLLRVLVRAPVSLQPIADVVAGTPLFARGAAGSFADVVVTVLDAHARAWAMRATSANLVGAWEVALGNASPGVFFANATDARDAWAVRTFSVEPAPARNDSADSSGSAGGSGASSGRADSASSGDAPTAAATGASTTLAPVDGTAGDSTAGSVAAVVQWTHPFPDAFKWVLLALIVGLVATALALCVVLYWMRRMRRVSVFQNEGVEGI